MVKILSYTYKLNSMWKTYFEPEIVETTDSPSGLFVFKGEVVMDSPSL